MKALQKLYELAELARQLVVDGRPSSWRYQGMKGPITGRPMYNVYTDEEFGEVVASLTFSEDDPEWDREAHARYIAACNPEVIMAIAAEFRRTREEVMAIQSSKSVQAKDTEVGKFYKRDGTHMYFMRVTNCGNELEEGYLFVSVFGGPGVISNYKGDALFKPVNVDMTIDD